MGFAFISLHSPISVSMGSVSPGLQRPQTNTFSCLTALSSSWLTWLDVRKVGSKVSDLCPWNHSGFKYLQVSTELCHPLSGLGSWVVVPLGSKFPALVEVQAFLWVSSVAGFCPHSFLRGDFHLYYFEWKIWVPGSWWVLSNSTKGALTISPLLDLL